MREAQVEKKLVKEVEKRGGICYKFVSPSNPGVPDRIVITPDGRVIFVELKAPFGRMSNIQKWQKARMLERGADVRVVYGLEQVEELVREVFTA
jgi:hypothetical protein